MNTMIELHDSTIAEITKREREIIVHFQPAYIHKSEGRPGIDAGAGWVQDAYLHFTEASIVGDPPELPCDVWDGEMMVGAKRLLNSIPAPIASNEEVQMKIEFATADTITIKANGARIELVGEPKYVEEY